jgi:hypothetical protein
LWNIALRLLAKAVFGILANYKEKKCSCRFIRKKPERDEK